MILTDEQIEEFQQIYKDQFGTEISKEEARENGTKLLRLISLLYRPADQDKNKTNNVSGAKNPKKIKVEKTSNSI